MVSKNLKMLMALMSLALVICMSAWAGVVIKEDFEDGNASRWKPWTPKRWEVVKLKDGNHVYFLNTSDFDNIGERGLGEASLIDPKVEKYVDFTLRCRMLIMEDFPANAWPDANLAFNYQDKTNYYRADINAGVDALVNDMLVNVDLQWQDLCKETLPAVKVREWVELEIERKGKKLFYRIDGKELCAGEDDTFSGGLVGVGAFNDSAQFDDFVMEIPEVAGLSVESGGKLAITWGKIKSD